MAPFCWKLMDCIYISLLNHELWVHLYGLQLIDIFEIRFHGDILFLTFSMRFCCSFFVEINMFYRCVQKLKKCKLMRVSIVLSCVLSLPQHFRFSPFPHVRTFPRWRVLLWCRTSVFFNNHWVARFGDATKMTAKRNWWFYQRLWCDEKSKT